jgi:hypothetical protein
VSVIDRAASLTILVGILEPLLRTPATDSRSLWSQLPPGLHDDALDVMANVTHFADDADIRQRDPAYRRMQEEHMRRLIAALRAGAPAEELLRYNFLTPLRDDVDR